jgi:hypothetical protein
MGVPFCLAFAQREATGNISSISLYRSNRVGHFKVPEASGLKISIIDPLACRRLDEDVATAVTHFIRVRAGTNEPQVTFIAFSLSNLVTGTCEIVR